MTLKEKYYALVRKAYHLAEDVEPDIVKLCKFAMIVVEAEKCCYNTEEEIGADVLAMCKKCVKMKKRSATVEATKLRQLLEESENKTE